MCNIRDFKREKERRESCKERERKAEGSQRGGSEIGVLVLELSVERQPPFVLVVGEQRPHHHHLAEGEARTHRAPVPKTPATPISEGTSNPPGARTSTPFTR